MLTLTALFLLFSQTLDSISFCERFKLNGNKNSAKMRQKDDEHEEDDDDDDGGKDKDKDEKKMIRQEIRL